MNHDSTLPGGAFIIPSDHAYARGTVGPPGYVGPKLVSVAPATAQAASDLRLLLRMPTRSRPEQAISTLEAYRRLAGVKILMEVIVDVDDLSMRRADILRALRDLDCVITTGSHKSKVEAVNAGRVSGWDVLVLGSDDMVPVVDGWAVQMLEDMVERFPLLDGALHYDDGYAADKLCTLPVVGRRLYERFGYVYCPEYRSMWCDNEQTDVFRALGRLAYLPKKLVEHRHPAAGKAAVDPLYDRNGAMALWDQDFATYERRKNTKYLHAQTGFDLPPLWLSVGIATLPARRQCLDRLVDHLFSQMKEFPGEVEILVDFRSPPVSIGAKRQSLLEKARGHYVAFIDDDDWVSHDYLARTLEAVREQPDCTALKVLMMTGANRVDPCEVSIKYREWSVQGGVYCRTPNHLSAVRRDLALKVGFTDISHGEDAEYSKWLRPLLQTESSTGDDPIYYYLFDPKKGA